MPDTVDNFTTSPVSDTYVFIASSGPGKFLNIFIDSINTMKVKDLRENMKNHWLVTKVKKSELVSHLQKAMG